MANSSAITGEMGHAGSFMEERGREQGNPEHAPTSGGTGFCFTRMPRFPGARAFCAGGIEHRGLNIDPAPAHRYGPLPLLKGPSSVKIRKFTVALAASALAVTGLATPTASAIDVRVGEDVCTTHESYEGENDLFFETYMDSADEMLANLKTALTEDEVADVDRYIAQGFSNSEEFTEIEQRLMTSGLDAGFREGEVHSLASLISVIKLTPPWSNSIEALGPIKRSEASTYLLQARINLAVSEKASAPSTTSALAWEIAEPQRSWWRTLDETQVNILEICVDGTDGSFSFGGTNPAKGGSSAPAGGSSR